MASLTPKALPNAAEMGSYKMSWMTTMALLTNGRSLSGYERNCGYLNLGEGRMANISAVSGFDFPDDGRGLAYVDWDHDGDLDMWVSSRNSPACRMLRNDLKPGASFVALRLEGAKSNRDAIGARVELLGKRPSAKKRIQTVHAGDGFLSQSSKTLHFGLGASPDLDRAVVRWPSGLTETFPNLQPGQFYHLKEGSGVAARWAQPKRKLALSPAKLEAAPISNAARIFAYSQMPLPALAVTTWDGQKATLGPGLKRPMLLTIWSSTCPNCARELTEFSAQRAAFEMAGLDVAAVCTDLVDPSIGKEDGARQFLKKLRFPFAAYWGAQDVIDQLEVFHRTLVHTHLTLPVPTNVLIDQHGRIGAIYRGPVSVAQAIADAKALGGDLKARAQSAQPFPGQRPQLPQVIDPIQVALKFFEGGYDLHARNYLRQLIEIVETNGPGHETMKREEVHYLMATLLEDADKPAQAAQAYQYILSFKPDHRNARLNLARLLVKQDQLAASAPHYEKAIALAPGESDEVRLELAQVWLRLGQKAKAEQETRAVLRRQPNHETAKKIIEHIAKP